MSAATRSDNKYHVEGIVDLGLLRQPISVVEVEDNGYLAFRRAGDSTIRISNAALHDMVRDLSSGKMEKMGFLLGQMYMGSALFTKYQRPDWVTRREFGLSYRRKEYIKYTKKAGSLGFDVLADVHNHIYENIFEVKVDESVSSLPVAHLLRHGLFHSLEKSAGFTGVDIQDSREDYTIVKNIGSLSRSFSGVYERFRLSFNDARVMMLHFASGPYMENHHGVVASRLGK